MLRRSFIIPLLSGLCASTLFAAPVMVGGLGGHGPGSDSTNDGALVSIDQTTGQTTLIGHPSGVARLTGIAFDSSGALLGSTVGAIPFPPPPAKTTSSLIEINPKTGALESTIGAITDGASGPAMSISDLAEQPGTGTLFGIRADLDGLGQAGNLYTINKQTGVASKVGNTGHAFGSIAFAPDGTLYMTAADHGPVGAPANFLLLMLDPTNGQVIGSKPTNEFYGALGVRPTDGALFAGNGDKGQIFTLDPATGSAKALSGTTGTDFVGDIDFEPSTTAIPLPAGIWTGGIMLLGLVGAGVIRRRRALA